MVNAIFYIGISDPLSPALYFDSCFIVDIPEELGAIRDMMDMLMMDHDEEDARAELEETYPVIPKVSRAMTSMTMRARFQSTLEGPYLVKFPEGMKEEDVTKELVEQIVLSKPKDELRSFLKGAKI